MKQFMIIFLNIIYDKVYRAFKKIRWIENEEYWTSWGDIRKLDIELVPLVRLIENYKNEEIQELKNEILSEINQFLEKLFNNYQFFVWFGFVEEEMDLEMMYRVSDNNTISFEWRQWWKSNIFILQEVAYFLQETKFEEQYAKEIWTLDINSLQDKILKYWAKGANLLVIKDLLEKITNSWSGLFDDFSIPDFKLISTSIYDKWIKWGDISEDLKPYYKQIKWKIVIIRSSAVYSEDGENATWAWIYDSIEFDTNNNFKDFQDTIEQVYKSVDSSNAISYRKNMGIKQEKMWIIVQELIEDKVTIWNNEHHIKEKWYINTVVKWVPELMDIVLNNWLRPVINKNIIQRKSINTSDDSIFYYQIDITRLEDICSIEWFAKLSYLFEKYYDKPLQIEFLIREYYDSNYLLNKELIILQTRFLPSNYLEKEKVDFPDKKVLFEWRALWIWDLELDILANREDNSQKEWIVIFKTSKSLTLHQNIDKRFPKSWVVIVLWESIEDHWHIETLCAEKWLLLVFNKFFQSNLRNTYRLPGSFWLDSNLIIDDVDEYLWRKRLHIVMDWLVGRVYACK